MKVSAWAADGSGCWWYRLEMPLRELARRGVIDALDIDERLDAWTRLSATEPRVVIGQRVCKPGVTETWQAMAKAGKHTLIYELDDDLLNVDPSSVISYNFFRQPEIQDNVKRNAEVADHVTVSTEALAETMRQYNDSVHVLPNGIPEALLGWDMREHGRDPVRRGPVVVGWQGSATHAMDWADAAPYVDRAIRQAHPNALLRIFGGNAEWFASMKCRREHIRWVTDIWAYYRGLRMDIALAPLRPHLFNRSKSPIRVMEAGALGIPVIASAAGPYESYVKDDETGWLARRDHDWGRLLRHMINHPDERARMGAAAREQAREHTIEGPVGDAWEKFYRTLGEK